MRTVHGLLGVVKRGIEARQKVGVGGSYLGRSYWERRGELQDVDRRMYIQGVGRPVKGETGSRGGSGLVSCVARVVCPLIRASCQDKVSFGNDRPGDQR